MIKKKGGVVVVISTCLVLIAAIIALVWWKFNNKKGFCADYADRLYAFPAGESEEYKTEIREYLKSIYFENEQYAGFGKYGVMYAEHFTNACVLKEAIRLGDTETCDKIKTYYSSAGFGFFRNTADYIGYKYIMDKVNPGNCDYNKLLKEVKDANDNVYNESMRLMLFGRFFGNEYVLSEYDWYEYVKSELKEYDITSTDTEYIKKNSGYVCSDLIVAANYDVLDRIVTPEYKTFFETAKKIMEEDAQKGKLTPDDMMFFARAYYYVTGDKSLWLETEDDYFTIGSDDATTFDFQDFAQRDGIATKDHPEYDEKVRKLIREYAGGLKVKASDVLELIDTYYAVVLADSAGFEYDKEKVAAYIKKQAEYSASNSIIDNYSAIYSVLIAGIIDRIDVIPKEYVSYIDDALNDIDYSEASSLETLAPLLRVRLCIDPKYKVKKADYDKMKSLVGAYEKLCSESESYKLYLSEDYILYRMMLGMKIPDDCAEQFKKECFDGINLRFEDKDLEGYYYRMILKNIENGL
ncbi:MAG TPA: hypothetical protein DCX21_01100 [Eubacterium sp.]|nr:hypothetical protein [Eubacterium sp.]